MIENFTLPDGAGHTFGPHGNCTRAAYRDSASRLARVLGELANNDRLAALGEPARLGETFIVLTGDHGMENQNPAGKDFANGVFFGELADADVEFLWQDRNVYLLTMHAELVGSPDGYIPPGQQTLTFRITDDDVDPTGARRPIAGASVRAANGREVLTGTTNAAGDGDLHVHAAGERDHARRRQGRGSGARYAHDRIDVARPDHARPGDQSRLQRPADGLHDAAGRDCVRRDPQRAAGSRSSPGRRTLQVTDKTPDTKDRLQWKWQKGAATTVAAFGDPLINTAYGLCIYDGGSTLIASATIPAGGTCNAKSPRPCWRASRNGFRYVDRDLTPSGIQQLVLRAGAAGKAQIGLKGKGALLDTPDLPISSLPIRVQLVSSDGQCWEATYSTTFRNQDDRLKAKSD